MRYAFILELLGAISSWTLTRYGLRFWIISSQNRSAVTEAETSGAHL